ncbi:MAG: hypothetical protein IJP26_05620 [Clostridia bacterium]|nr:hypothetical protein [Clostridia bacterium]
MAKRTTEEHLNELYKLFVSINNEEDCKNLLEDLCTYKEVEQMAERICAAKLLMQGKTYTEVIAKTDISSATLSRISRCVQYGKGYSKLLK